MFKLSFLKKIILDKFMRYIFVILLILMPFGNSFADDQLSQKLSAYQYEQTGNWYQFDIRSENQGVTANNAEIQNIEIKDHEHFEALLDNGISISGKYKMMLEIPMLNKRIISGQGITNEDVFFSKLSADKVKKDIITNAEELVGSTAKTQLLPNKPIRKNELSKINLVSKNSAVKIIYKHANMTIEASMLALDDGALGEAIRVKNEQSGKIIRADVIGKGMVKSQLSE